MSHLAAAAISLPQWQLASFFTFFFSIILQKYLPIFCFKTKLQNFTKLFCCEPHMQLIFQTWPQQINFQISPFQNSSQNPKYFSKLFSKPKILLKTLPNKLTLSGAMLNIFAISIIKTPVIDGGKKEIPRLHQLKFLC